MGNPLPLLVDVFDHMKRIQVRKLFAKKIVIPYPTYDIYLLYFNEFNLFEFFVLIVYRRSNFIKSICQFHQILCGSIRQTIVICNFYSFLQYSNCQQDHKSKVFRRLAACLCIKNVSLIISGIKRLCVRLVYRCSWVGVFELFWT